MHILWDILRVGGMDERSVVMGTNSIAYIWRPPLGKTQQGMLMTICYECKNLTVIIILSQENIIVSHKKA